MSRNDIRQNMTIAQLVDLALHEDLLLGDVTSDSTIPKELLGKAEIFAKEEIVFAGREVASEVFSRFASIQCDWQVQDGDHLQDRDSVVWLEGSLRELLKAERVALNFLMRLSGIATGAHRITSVLPEGANLKIVDTRKTTPGWRMIEKSAVRAGGAYNHRSNLGDGILIKENHIKSAGSITLAVGGARRSGHHLLKIEVETTTIDEVREALEVRADVIMLDNMNDEQTRQCIELIRATRAETVIEASGNMTAERLPKMNELGVDIVSMGALTHAARSIDLSMKVRSTDVG